MTDEKVVIAGLWELSWDTPMMEMRYWELLVRDFSVDKLHMSPISGIRNKWVEETKDIRESIAKYPDLKVVHVCEEGDVPLTEFVHPEKAIYLFGKGTYSPFNDMKTESDLSVRIEVPGKRGLLLAPVCAGILLHDRHIKNGINNNR